MRPIWTIGKIEDISEKGKNIGKLFYRFQFPEVKPDSFFKLFGGERLVVGKRAEEFVSSGDYDDHYDQADVKFFGFSRNFVFKNVIKNQKCQNERKKKGDKIMI